MSETISFNVFSRSSIAKAKERLTKIQQKVEGGSADAVRNLTQAGYEYMLTLAPIESGELVESITWEYDEQTNTGRIRVGADYALFVEYGTGIVGAQNPHPEPAPGWTYDVNAHGEKGWTYFVAKQNRYQWTKGEPAHAFVYKTREYMKSIADEKLRVAMAGA